MLAKGRKCNRPRGRSPTVKPLVSSSGQDRPQTKRHLQDVNKELGCGGVNVGLDDEKGRQKAPAPLPSKINAEECGEDNQDGSLLGCDAQPAPDADERLLLHAAGAEARLSVRERLIESRTPRTPAIMPSADAGAIESDFKSVDDDLKTEVCRRLLRARAIADRVGQSVRSARVLQTQKLGESEPLTISERRDRNERFQKAIMARADLRQSSPSIKARRAPPPALKRWSSTAMKPKVTEYSNGSEVGSAGIVSDVAQGHSMEEDAPSTRHRPLSFLVSRPPAASLPPPPPPATNIERGQGVFSAQSSPKLTWWRGCVCLQ